MFVEREVEGYEFSSPFLHFLCRREQMYLGRTEKHNTFITGIAFFFHQRMLRVKRNWRQLFSEMKVSCMMIFEVVAWFLILAYGKASGSFGIF